MKRIYIVLALIFTLINISAKTKQKVILNIASYHKGYGWTDTCINGINKIIGDKYKVVNYYMDTKRLNPSKHEFATRKALKEVLKVKPDLVMLGDDNALDYLNRKLVPLKIPFVFYGINAHPKTYFLTRKLPPQMAGVLERPLIIPLARYIMEISPKTSNIVVMFDNSTTSRAISENTLYKKQNLKIGKTTLHFKHFTKYNNWKNFINHAHKHYDAIILSTLFTLKNKRGKTASINNVLTWTSKNTKIPLYGTLEFMTGNNAGIGSLVIIGERHGEIAANIAIQILEGNYPNKFKFKTDMNGQLFFNKVQMKRFNIKLPERLKSKVRYRN